MTPKATENDNMNKQLSQGEKMVYACVVVKMSATDRIALMICRILHCATYGNVRCSRRDLGTNDHEASRQTLLQFDLRGGTMLAFVDDVRVLVTT